MDTFYAVVVVAKLSFFHIAGMAQSREVSSTSYWQMGTWLEKEKKEKWKNSSLKCKVLMKFEGEMNSMSALKKTKGYSGAWLASTKDPCNRKL